MADRNNNVFTKQPNERGSALAEAAGLRWLAEPIPNNVVRVVSVSDTELKTERVSQVNPTPEAAFAAGQAIARMHRAGAEAHGAPPAPGGEVFEGQNFIGTQPQECTPTEKWGEFYVHQRVEPFVDMASKSGHLTDRDKQDVERACRLIVSSPYNPPVARIHGDLWTGNLLFSPEGPMLIDPAAHGGAALTDIAMLALFGAPYFDRIIAGYETVQPLEENWRQLIPLHQMHPLAVHAATHGPSYGRELGQAARAVLTTWS